MNERLVEDWLNKANERLYQTPFAQALLAEGFRVLRVGHGSHEHGKDIIAVDLSGKVHAYQLKDGDLDLTSFEKGFPQVTALVESQVEHPAIANPAKHQPWLVISGQATMPVEDRIRAHNLQWRRRKYTPLKLMTGSDLLAKFVRMSANFWPQKLEDSRNLLTLYLADGRKTLDRIAFVKLIEGVLLGKDSSSKTGAARRISAANLFTSYALSAFYRSENHWEVIQGWTITAALIAWTADSVDLARDAWHPAFRLAVNSALVALDALTEEALETNALFPKDFELDELTRSRATICAGLISTKLLLERKANGGWERDPDVKILLERLLLEKRHFLWGESAIPFFLVQMWALDNLRADSFSETLLFTAIFTLANISSRNNAPKLASPYESADEATAKLFDRLLNETAQSEMRACISYSLEALVTLAARRLWRNALASCWSRISHVDLVRLVPDNPRDLLLWSWGHERGANQMRRYSAPQSWSQLLSESRRDESASLPRAIMAEFDFALLFLLTFPHRVSPALVKYYEIEIGSL